MITASRDKATYEIVNKYIYTNTQKQDNTRSLARPLFVTSGRAPQIVYCAVKQERRESSCSIFPTLPRWDLVATQFCCRSKPPKGPISPLRRPRTTALQIVAVKIPLNQSKSAGGACLACIAMVRYVPLSNFYARLYDASRANSIVTRYAVASDRIALRSRAFWFLHKRT